MNRVRIGIVGLGWWACDVHIPNFLRVPEARVAALCSRSQGNLRRGLALCAQGPESPRAFGSYDELLTSDAVDAVVVCTPNFTHASLALAALRAGKHVLVEKPLALDPADCPLLIREAERRGLVLQVGLELRYADVVQTMRRLIGQGLIGQPTVLATRVWRYWPGAPGGWRADPANSGGTLHELAIHYLDLLSFLAPHPPLWVSAAGGSRIAGRDIDYALATIGYGGEVVGSAGMCLFAPGAIEEVPVEVVGTEGRLVGEVTAGKLTLWSAGGERHDRSPRRREGKVFGFPGSFESAASFVECIRTGSRPVADGAAGERLCVLCEAARRSLQAGGQREPIGVTG